MFSNSVKTSDRMDADARNAATDAGDKGVEVTPAVRVEPGISVKTDLQYEQDDSLSIKSSLDESSRNSPLCLSVKKADVQKKCGDWLASRSSHVQEKALDYRSLQKRRQDECDSPDENDDTDDMLSSTSANKRKRRMVKLKDEQLDLRCEWQDCDYLTCNVDHFVRHVSLHIPDLEVKVNEAQEGVYACLWESCGFESSDASEIMRHVNYHSYHTKIKCIGSNILARTKLPACTFLQVGKNLIPDLPDPFACCWDDCERTFNNSQMYFDHIQTHVHCNPRGNNVVGGVPCSWRGCKSVFRSVYKLADHVRSHTQEKLVGCPTCGGLFATKTKFFDHCKRQVPLEMQEYQCSHCSKYYPSERLLRDHMRHHVNHYKCSFCDMTCPTPSSLSVHIRYRHLDSKPFKCNFCEYTAKTQYDMKNHLNTHCSDPIYRCQQEGCGFSCRSSYGLRRHYDKFHRGNDEPLYCCHICDDRFQRGSLLTRHLFTHHGFRWPSGHCRFRYKHDEDGFFRLQTVRYESLEVTQEMMRSQSHTQMLCGSSQYNLHQVNGRNGVEITVAEDKVEPQKQDTGGNKIVISFKEVDNSGSVVHSKVIETEEVPALPPGAVTLVREGSQKK